MLTCTFTTTFSIGVSKYSPLCAHSHELPELKFGIRPNWGPITTTERMCVVLLIKYGMREQLSGLSQKA